MYSLDETVERVSDLGVVKVHKTMKQRCILGFIAGAMISLGYLAYIKIVATVDGGLGNVLGASVFPIGLIVILLAGGELITGNMTVVGTSYANQKVTLKELTINWFIITVANLVGAVFVALILGRGELSHYTETVNRLAMGKASYSPMATLISGIGCNWFVGLSVWLNVAIKDGAGKIMGIWFPVMVFVLLGFQHSVANMFLLTAGMQNGVIQFSEFASNIFFSYIGNIIGGAVLVGYLYTHASHEKNHNA
ncbi:formate/nitrite transporter family protein [Erysipelothrix rhusiopathiae]|uniref:Formate/nitrite transporter n=1 Tax=Erysipelothrix rhusiopathiae ATCC 19414 TaxID=525280 RepID=E7FWT8_ERYRH|nr:formate/nitrite transporter family protein [Erysipelothrix rhusiopathiae]EFY08637.1 formate/nitrite transporter [Erysipelothrix rhusiopathiae ATCC 19414]MDE8255860.1 formate/nitrite transporter family protein [Erysipelothrix rhusiopathiae]MDE8341346.1 formate/nitrite transporter family protein [Erysipelothrix rhusiopathiae]MDV7680561.1 formate/nitrite transporter family protein [Erysipelothrix rhusiopathiae]RNM29964.1 formate/nitrite transporter family protein [Erysipelothrix rhusiopathiae]